MQRQVKPEETSGSVIRARFPPPLAPGDRVGVAALSGPVEAERLEAGLEALRGLDLEPVLAENLSSHAGLFAGTDSERLEAFESLVADPGIKAIFFARGGSGILRVLPALDWKLLASIPRAYIGYSDVTPLLNTIVERLGWVAFHGPMIAVECAEGLEHQEKDALWNLLSDATMPSLEVEGAVGSASGVLKGGCLSMLASTAGTEFATDLSNAVLFWEDVDEPLYRLDRMLTQLKLSGSLSQIEAMIAGRIELLESNTSTAPLPDYFASLAEDLNRPVAWGLSSGHCRPNLTLPLGAAVVLDGAAGRLRMAE